MRFGFAAFTIAAITLLLVDFETQAIAVSGQAQFIKNRGAQLDEQGLAQTETQFLGMLGGANLPDSKSEDHSMHTPVVNIIMQG